MAIYQGETRVANNYQIDNSVYCVPIGSIIPYASTTLPKGFLLCDGAEISKTDYADLYAVIGDTFGTATDNIKFKLPDLRDKFVQGANGNLGTSKEAGLPNITGNFTIVGNNNAAFYGDAGGAFTTQNSGYNSFVNGSGQVGLESNTNWTFNASKSNSIYGNSTTVQPPAVCLCYIIKATKLSDIPVDVSGVIDDNATGANSTWSSNKISNQLQSVDATTFDGKSANVFLQNQGILSNGDLLEHILTMTDSGYFFASSGVTSTPVEGQWFWVDVKRDERGDYCVTATRYNQSGVYTNRYNNNSDMKKWYGWSNVSDGGNAATVNSHTVLSNVPANAKFTGINDTSITSTTETWSAKKINDSSFAGRIVISMDMANTDTTLSATLNPTNGAYLYWASRAGNAQVYEIGMFLYTQTSWTKIPIKATDTATTVTFSLNGNKLTATRSSTTSFPTACGVIALGKNI